MTGSHSILRGNDWGSFPPIGQNDWGVIPEGSNFFYGSIELEFLHLDLPENEASILLISTMDSVS